MSNKLAKPDGWRWVTVLAFGASVILGSVRLVGSGMEVAGGMTVSGLGFFALIALVPLAIAKPPEMPKGHRRNMRLRFTIEVGIMLIIAALLVDGALGALSGSGDKKLITRLSDQASNLSRAEQAVGLVRNGQTDANYADLMEKMKDSGFDTEGDALREVIMSATVSRIDESARSRALVLLKRRREAVVSEFTDVLQQQGVQSARVQRSIIGIIVSLIVLFAFSRSSRAKDLEILRALEISDQARGDYQDLVENVPVALFSYRNGEILFHNSAWHQLSGNPEVEAAKREFLETIHPDDAMVVKENLNSGTPVPFRVHYKMREHWGSHRHFVMQGTPIFDARGQYSHTLAFIIDISENMQARLALQRKNEEIQSKNEMLAATLEDLENNIESVVRSLVKAVDAKDPYTAGHSERVMQYSLQIGEELGLGPYELRVLQLGTLVHDVGKIGMPDRVLLKPDKLTPEEFEIVKTHPVQGVKILESIHIFQECIPIVRWHHEKLDGSGYPDGLKGDKIPYLVRICCVADMFDAMTSTRSYRAGMDAQTVVKILYDDAHKGKIDLMVVQAMERAVAKHGVIYQPPSLYQQISA
jgi:PAS domain S-box-containing protein